MTHVAAIYTVRIHRLRHPDELALLGDIGGSGAQLLWALNGYLTELDTSSDDDKKHLRCTSAAVDEPLSELRARFDVGLKGQRQDLFEGEDHKFAQQPIHTGRVRAGALFKLPPDGNLGHLAVYVPYGRSAITLLTSEMGRKFRDDFPGFLLRVTPMVEASALTQAIEQDRVEKIELIRYDHHSDTFAGGSAKWTRRGAVAEIALEIRSRRRERLAGGLLQRYLAGESEVFGEIVEFEGLTFENVRVQVEQEGRRRTYNIEKPESGHAMTIDIADQLLFDEDGWPTDDSLFKALRGALPTVTPPA